MSLGFMIAIYFVLWWLVLFAVLPFGVHTQAEAGSVVPGTPESAPANFRLMKVVIATTIASAVIFALVWALFRTGLIQLPSYEVPST